MKLVSHKEGKDSANNISEEDAERHIWAREREGEQQNCGVNYRMNFVNCPL